MKKGQLLNKFSKIPRPNVKKKAKFAMFGLGKANLATLLCTLTRTNLKVGRFEQVAVGQARVLEAPAGPGHGGHDLPGGHVAVVQPQVGEAGGGLQEALEAGGRHAAVVAAPGHVEPGQPRGRPRLQPGEQGAGGAVEDLAQVEAGVQQGVAAEVAKEAGHLRGRGSFCFWEVQWPNSDLGHHAV